MVKDSVTAEVAATFVTDSSRDCLKSATFMTKLQNIVIIINILIHTFKVFYFIIIHMGNKLQDILEFNKSFRLGIILKAEQGVPDSISYITNLVGDY